jgi:hypothetical protein
MARRVEPPPPQYLRAHRPVPGDATVRPAADVQEERYVETEDVLPRRRNSYLFFIVSGMLLMVALWMLLSWYVVPFIMRTIQHWNCGTPPGVCQYDINVGHGGTSHFIAEYWHDEVVMIEVPGGKVSETHSYYAPIYPVGKDTTPRIVTLTTAYVAHHPVKGKPDLVATVSGFALPVIFYNTGTGFSTEDYS